jgi:type II secretory pathway component PulF
MEQSQLAIFTVSDPKENHFMAHKGYTDDLVLFTQHLGSAIRGGLPLHQTVELLSGEMAGRAFRNALAEVARDLRAGETLYNSLSKHKEFFPDYYLRVLHAGEESGTLPETLTQLADLLQKNFLIGQRIKRVFAYPVTVTAILTSMIVGARIYIIPQFRSIYEELGVELPAGFVFLLNYYYVLTSFMLALLVLVFLMARRYGHAGWGGLVFDWFDLNLPFLGVFTRYAIASRLTRTLATMLRNGIALPEAMSLCGEMLGNSKAQESIETARRSVERGETLGTSMLGDTLFPPTLIWMISAAEVKGDFIGTLDHLADFYSSKVEQTILWTMEILEPLCLIVVGAFLLTIAVGLYSPIFSLANGIGIF